MFGSWASWTLRHERPCPRGRPGARGSASGRAPATRIAAAGVHRQQPDRQPWRVLFVLHDRSLPVVRSQAVASSLSVRRGGLSWRPTLNLHSAPAAPLLGGSGAEPVGVLGGAIGYFGYDTDQLLERVPATAVDEGLPELDIGIYDLVLATDHLSGEG